MFWQNDATNTTKTLNIRKNKSLGRTVGGLWFAGISIMYYFRI